MTSLDPVTACLLGEISPEVALARLVLNGETEAAIRQRLESATERTEHWAALDRLATSSVIDRLRRTIDSADVQHADASTPARIAEQFDRAVQVSPEASVAMYSLGDLSILDAATAEILGWLTRNELIHSSAAVLDLGCGIGRVAASLAGHVRSVLGVDISSEMVQEASRRCAGLPNVTFAVIAGTDLAICSGGVFDLVLAVDTFPYLIQAGVAERLVAECRRVLCRGGHLAILNFSYRGDPERDRQDANTWAGIHGFSVQRHAERPFRLWDASCWVFRRD
jgi:SAM-dependent methyltransferase